MTNEEWLDALDRTWREPVVRRTHVMLKQYRRVNKDDAWNRVMYSWYKQGFEHLRGHDVKSDRVLYTLQAAMKTTVFHIAEWESQRRGHFKGSKRPYECVASELGENEGMSWIDQVVEVVEDSVMYDATPGIMHFLTDKQREAVEMLVLARMMPEEASSLVEGSTPDRVRGNARQGLTGLRSILEGKPNRKHKPDDPLVQKASELALAKRPFRVVEGRIVELAA